MTANVIGFLMCWNFITSSPLPKLNEKKMKKITTEAQIKLHLPDIREDNCTNADCCSFRQPIAKPTVVLNLPVVNKPLQE